jgi:hypothetical protein
MVRLDTMLRVSPSIIPLTISWTWFRPAATVTAPFDAVAGGRPSLSPVRRTAYFSSASRLSAGPIVKTAGRLNCSFSTVMAWMPMLKSKGVMLILETFWKGYTNAFFLVSREHWRIDQRKNGIPSSE